jgi:hypothetical protein
MILKPLSRVQSLKTESTQIIRVMFFSCLRTVVVTYFKDLFDHCDPFCKSYMYDGLFTPESAVLEDFWSIFSRIPQGTPRWSISV